MTTTIPNPKHGVKNVVVDEVYVGVDSLTLQYGLSITASYNHTGQIRLIKKMQKTEK